MSQPVPPITPKRPVRSEWFGKVFVDDYAWIRNPDWFERLRTPRLLEPEIRAHLDAENAYADAVLAGTKTVQDEMIAQMLARSAADDAAPADVYGGWAYSSHLEPGAKHATLLRRPVSGGDAQILLDAEAEAAGKPYYRLSDFSDPTPSPDHRLFAWASDETGDQHFRLYVKDIASGQRASSVITSCYGNFAFSADSQWLYWVWRDPVSRPTKVFRRPAMGGEDVLIYEEKDPAFFIGLDHAASNGFVFIRIFDGRTTETWFIPGSDPTAAPALIEPRSFGVDYDVEHWNDQFVIRTNADGAVDFKLMLADPAAPGRANWRAWLPHRPGHYVSQIRTYADHLARIEWVDANALIIVRDKTGADVVIPMHDDAYAIALTGRAFDTTILTFDYQSPKTPPRAMAFDMASGVLSTLHQRQVPNFDAGDYIVRRLFAPATEGQTVPVTVLAHRDTPLEGSAPLYLYGYGSYGLAIPPEFSVANLALADRGFVTAIAHIRGGGERGPAWYEAARATGKKISITDFIACADHLVAQGFTGVGKIVAHSLSAGGIIIGGSVNLRPELWAGVINQVPFVDVLNTLHDETNPLLPAAFAVWGDPADPAVFDYIASYSAYENITPQAYPAALAIGGLLDNRVGYWESAKWGARLRENSTSGRPVMVRINMTAGHQGHAGLLPETQQAAFFNAFALWAAGKAG